MTLENRAKGCLLGLACGDAVGATLEFLPRERIATPLTDMVGGGKFQLERGKWTDDTSMALCLADSLLACQSFDAIDQLQRYCHWIDKGYNSSKEQAFGIGKQTLKEVLDFYKTGRSYSQNADPNRAGNGSLMRLAPIALFFFHQPQNLERYAKLSSKTTHAAAACLEACGYFAKLLAHALFGNSKEEIFVGFDSEEFQHIAHIVRGDYRHKTADEIKGSGYVVESLEAALWAFWHTDNFRDAILLAANLGDDADTTAAICGQIAGAFYGEQGIPSQWLEWLYRKEDIAQIAERLIAHRGVGKCACGCGR
ncbi:ADP-ribosylation/crystallin J1 [Bibersteinia trehalosi USDA-ARS-USMARC-190]|uniref:ADP-ribosylation/crystallin J1 n=1 Tax=Bibersteinia trehalosi USDA-ARS-USMARC-190 TaxID=1263832 RepID=W0R6B0_BIBTR|nr:ADP-ribosylglycohydrolase family protein [Bibersteinia trehalosi]AHG85815.1 ADP-ribosylation/crystallin J1 [Bibersteinia trehalosi USDA-ARS-USMARC-190]